jgi:hypothetical protein
MTRASDPTHKLLRIEWVGTLGVGGVCTAFCACGWQGQAPIRRGAQQAHHAHVAVALADLPTTQSE